ncbi:alpha-1,2-fucosyltransferase [Marisediminicola sp. LYQ85]|uniref:alpha-1,2-fucosyltransferase n=1 Tax=Marisediminicola sp. LYQ85 TaxID=3391062 RepID=UPI0039839A96
MSRLKRSTTVWIQGGLGNQLFQLNAGLTASRRAGLPLLVSRSSYWRDSLRGFSLRPLLDSIQLTSHFEDVIVGPPHHRAGGVRTTTARLGVPITQSIEAAAEGPSLMVGYFQDQESLFGGTDEVQRLLGSIVIDDRYLATRDLVAGRPVAHVRRGDYVSLESARRTFGLLGPAYYEEAFSLLGHPMKDAVFFTDDAEYVREEFGVRRDQIIGRSDVKSDLQTLALMAHAGDLVIPNSTFSWWAAEQLASRGRVVAPARWFLDRDETQWPTRRGWLRVENK